MAHIVNDRVRDTSTTTGTGALTVSGTAPSSYRTFSAVCAVNDTLPYFVAHQTANEWETGLGTYSSANTITRTLVVTSSNANAAVNFSAGTKDVVLGLATASVLWKDNTGMATTQGLAVNGSTLGYSTGAGGSVTQATSRTTGVTINKACGKITLFNAAGSPTAATFTVTNSTVAATDTIVIHASSGLGNLYFFNVTAVAAGSFDVTHWTTGGTVTDSPVLNFAVIKAVTS